MDLPPSEKPFPNTIMSNPAQGAWGMPSMRALRTSQLSKGDLRAMQQCMLQSAHTANAPFARCH